MFFRAGAGAAFAPALPYPMWEDITGAVISVHAADTLTVVSDLAPEFRSS